MKPSGAQDQNRQATDQSHTHQKVYFSWSLLITLRSPTTIRSASSRVASGVKTKTPFEILLLIMGAASQRVSVHTASIAKWRPRFSIVSESRRRVPAGSNVSLIAQPPTS